MDDLIADGAFHEHHVELFFFFLDCVFFPGLTAHRTHCCVWQNGLQNTYKTQMSISRQFRAKSEAEHRRTAMHCLMMQDCFIRPGPPNFFISLQKWHSPHSLRVQASHFLQRVRLRRAFDALRLDESFTPPVAPDGDEPILDFVRLSGRGWNAQKVRMLLVNAVGLIYVGLIYTGVVVIHWSIHCIISMCVPWVSDPQANFNQYFTLSWIMRL